MKLDLLADNPGKLFWRYLISTVPASLLISLNFLLIPSVWDKVSASWAWLPLT